MSIIPSEVWLYLGSIEIFCRRRRQPEVGLKTSISQGVSLFIGLEYWTGLLD